MSPIAIPSAESLLRWYDRHRRRIPWRAEPGQTTDAYRVWLSEIMLQQTTVTAVIPYYERFVSRFPTVAALAEAPLDTVLSAWAGLGYYARARNLHACAQAVAAMGGFPRDIQQLQALPGIGAYTASAIGAIAFGIPTVPVDGNVERVTSRLFAIETPLPAAKPLMRAAAERLGTDPLARERPSDFAQALFDLGAGLCTPTSPGCGICPWTDVCEARKSGIADRLPIKAPKKARPVRYGVHFWLTDGDGNVLLRRRPERGLLGGMTELPGTPWRSEKWTEAEAMSHAPGQADWRLVGQVQHGFTHFELFLDIFTATAPILGGVGFQHPIADLGQVALPSVMQKCVSRAQGKVAEK